MKNEDRRSTQRLPFRVPLRVGVRKFGLPDQHAECINISAGGVYFATGWSFQEGAPVELLLTMPKEIAVRSSQWYCQGRAVRVQGIDCAARIPDVAIAFDRRRLLQEAAQGNVRLPVAAEGLAIAGRRA